MLFKIHWKEIPKTNTVYITEINREFYGSKTESPGSNADMAGTNTQPSTLHSRRGEKVVLEESYSRPAPG